MQVHLPGANQGDDATGLGFRWSALAQTGGRSRGGKGPGRLDCKPLGDGFTGVPVNELRGALVRPFWNGHLDAGLDFLIARGRTGQTTEVISLPGERPGESAVGVRIPSYAGASLTFRL